MTNSTWAAAAAAALILVVVGRPATAEIRYSDVVARVLPYGGFLLSGDAAPSSACYGAVQSLDTVAAASGGDRRAICRCYEGLSRSFPVNLDKAKLIPQLCHVTIHVAVTPNIDCDRI